MKRLLGMAPLFMSACAQHPTIDWQRLQIPRPSATVYFDPSPSWIVMDCSRVPEACGLDTDHWNVQLLVTYDALQQSGDTAYHSAVENWEINCEGRYGWRNAVSYYEKPFGKGRYLGTADFFGIMIPEGKKAKDVATNSAEVTAVCAAFAAKPPNKALQPTVPLRGPAAERRR